MTQPVAEEAFEVQACGPEQRADQAALFNACFRKRLDARDLSWRYDRNPHGSSLSFVARAPRGQAVSGYACNPRRAWVGGDPATEAVIGETGDVMTHPGWRKRGLFSDLDRAAMRAAREAGWPLVFGLPNRRSAHIFVNDLGWEQVGLVRPWSLVLRADGTAWRVRRAEGRARALRLPLDRLLAGRARARLRERAPDLHPEMLVGFPRDVDELARAVGRGFGLMVRRDAAYLTWRFQRGSSRLHRCLGLLDGDGRLAAFCVVQMPRDGEFTGYLVDVLGRDDAAVDAAIELGLACLETGGASVVQATAIDGSWWARRLAASGFRPPRPENHLIVILHVLQPEHPLVAAARTPERWYFTDGDRDDETMG